MKKTSRYFSSLSLKGLEKAGDVFLPGDSDFPSFKKLGCIEHIDRVAEHILPSDREGLKILGSLFFFTPRVFIYLLFWFLEKFWGFPGWVGDQIRLARIGLKGLFTTLYFSGENGSSYSGKTPLEVMEYSVSVYLDDLD